MVGAGLADLLTAPMWVVPTLVIKAVVALLFTSRSPRLLCPRNLAAAAGTCLLSPAAYGLAACLLMGSVHAFWPQFLGTLVQGVGSGVLFGRALCGAGPGAGALRPEGPLLRRVRQRRKSPDGTAVRGFLHQNWVPPNSWKVRLGLRSCVQPTAHWEPNSSSWLPL